MSPPTSDREEWRHLFEERAAVMEYCGLMSREQAERAARELVGEQYRAKKAREEE